MKDSVKDNAVWMLPVLMMVGSLSGVCAQVDSGMDTGHVERMHHEKSHDMDTIHQMFNYTAKIKRTAKKTPTGVETATESNDPKVASMIQEHVLAMRARMKNHQPIRAWDELFATLFKNADKVRFEITITQHGVKIVESSDDAYTVKIIHAHANAVSDFIRDGMMGMAKAHPSPTKVQATAKVRPAAFLSKGDGVTTCPVTGELVNRNIKAEINWRTVYFCCASCKGIVHKNPTQYLKLKLP